ncbi:MULTISPECIES: hypothetical protein [unclassified Streptomyces]|uniref:hypothetical protein n=1 Tax=unclassified Streptomyces TaxID=2593676 RepID=UPI000FFF28F9|nr:MULTISPECIES: hypothetical protein [unclassified Streptomyces]
MRRAVPLLVVLTSALVLAGCGRQPGTPASHGRPTSSNDPAFQPLAAYDLPDEDGRTIERARWTLAGRCMGRLGFDGLQNLARDPVPTWPQRPSGTGAFSMFLYASDDFRYGIQDPKEAERHGYHGAQADYERRHSKRKWTLPQYLALTGEFVGDDPKSVHGHRIPERGCLGEADRAIYGASPQDHRNPVLELETKSLRQGMRDPVWKKADKAWSGCMRAAGYHYATPGDAVTGSDRTAQELKARLSGQRRDTSEPSVLERKAATADARCKQRTGYIRTVHAIDVRIQKRLVAEHRTELDKQLRWERDAARKAHDVLEDQSS